MLNLREFRSTAEALPDLLNWAEPIEPGIVLCKNAMFLAGWFYSGPDVLSRGEGERTALSNQINTVLAGLGSGWASWVDAVRIPSTGYPAPERNHFRAAIPRLIDEERRRQWQAEGVHYEGEYAYVVGFMPPRKMERRVLRLVFDEDPQPGDAAARDASRVLQRFKADLAAVEQAVAGRLRMRRMGGGALPPDVYGVVHEQCELVNYLRSLIDGEPGVGVNLPPGGGFLDVLIGAERFSPGNEILVGRDYIACVAVEGFPSHSTPQILEALDHIPSAMRWSTRFLHLDQHEALQEAHRYRRRWRQKERGIVKQLLHHEPKLDERRDGHAVDRTAECEKLVKELSGARVGGGFYCANVILRDRDLDRLRRSADAVAKVIRRLNFVPRIETINTPEAWLGSLPGHTDPNLAQPFMETDRVADLLPLTGIWTGSEVATNPLYPPNSPPLLHASTTGAAPFRLNLDGHILGFGPTGAGKSTLEALIAAQAQRYPGMQVWSLDYKRSMMPMCLASDGRHYDLAGEDGPQLCPFAVLDTDNDRAWAADLAATMFQLQTGRPFAPAQRTATANALNLMRRPGEGRSLSHFHMLVQDQEVKDAFRHYVGDGPAAFVLDGEADGVEPGHFNCFEMEDLLGLGDLLAIPTLLTIFRRFEASLTGGPALLDLQEAWALLMHPVMEPRIWQWLRTMRSKNCTVMIWTQSLGEVMESSKMALLTENCPHTIYLPNAEAFTSGTPGPYEFYRAKGLNDTQIAIIQSATPKGEYYMVSGSQCRLFNLELGPVAHLFTTATSKADAKRVKELHAQHGPARWPYAFMEERGVAYEHLVPPEDRPARSLRSGRALEPAE